MSIRKKTESPNSNSKEFMYPYVQVALFTIAKIQKQAKCRSVHEWLKKNCGTFTQWNTTQKKKEGIPAFCDSMDGTGDYCVK